jgi:hypothetical protein
MEDTVMTNSVSASRGLKMVLLAAIAVVLFVAMFAQLPAQETGVKAESEPSKLAADLIGTWQLVGRPDDAQEMPVNAFKFFTGKHWCVTYHDENGAVQYHHGGSYTLDGDQYAETIKYATEQTAGLIGQTMKYKIKVEGDKYTQIGVGNEYNEVWRRAK